jgi:hypothetical protein
MLRISLLPPQDVGTPFPGTEPTAFDSDPPFKLDDPE